MISDLKVIRYPDPRLKAPSSPVERFDQELADLANSMLQIMREHKGVGLAAPQVGRNIRLFVMNPTGQDPDARIYVNPELRDPRGEESGEEGCLSIPDVTAQITRNQSVTLRAFDLSGRPIEQTETGYVARIWQHEVDHLDGILITDRMGATARMLARKTLRELEEQYAADHPAARPAPKRKRARVRR
jgi:peptide deformylase